MLPTKVEVKLTKETNGFNITYEVRLTSIFFHITGFPFSFLTGCENILH